MRPDKDLIVKYNVPVPRYTSYPPATEFAAGISGPEYLSMVDESNNKRPGNIALYVHIPFCRKICYYCGCNAIAAGKGSDVIPYLTALKKEIEIVSAHLNKKREITQIHFGGGTPNILEPHQISEIMDRVRAGLTVADRAEIAIECHPAYLDEDYINYLGDAGFNRLSLGIQDFDARILKAVNRTPSHMPVEDIVALLRRRNISVNLDFIYGLPGQTVESFLETIKRASEIRPDRIVTFSYAHVPWIKKHQIILDRKGLPGAEEKSSMFHAANEKLTSDGYRFIGLDHYVLPGDELAVAVDNHNLHRNFQGYCTRQTTGQVYAFGVSAISQLEEGYVQNTREISEYIRLLENGHLPTEHGLRLTPVQQVTREVVNEVMCNKRLSWRDLSSVTGIEADVLSATYGANHSRLDQMETDGLITINKSGIEVTDTGSFFIRNIAAALDPEFSPGSGRFSRAV